MKPCKIYILFFALFAFALMEGKAQGQEYKIPLSDPGKAGKLYVRVHQGFIKVTGYSGKEVIIAVAPHEDDDDGDSRHGLRRVANVTAPFEIIEENNEVRVQGTGNNHINFEIKVPNKFSVQLKAHHDGYIEVNDVEGEIEVDGHHEDVVLNNVGGSVIADTHHGNITVSFTKVTPGIPLAFSTYHGDIDVSFPSGVNGAMKLKITKGEVYTDFDMTLVVESSSVKSSTAKGTKIEVGGWLTGNLGSGGPEYLFSTYHGDIILREK